MHFGESVVLTAEQVMAVVQLQFLCLYQVEFLVVQQVVRWYCCVIQVVIAQDGGVFCFF